MRLVLKVAEINETITSNSMGRSRGVLVMFSFLVTMFLIAQAASPTREPIKTKPSFGISNQSARTGTVRVEARKTRPNIR